MSETARGRLKIVYLGHTAALSGGEIGLSRLIAASPRVQAHVILAEYGPFVDALEDAGATVEVLPLASGVREVRREELTRGAASLTTARAVFEYSRQLSWRLRALQPDLVHSNTLKSGVYGVLAARLARLPIIWGLHDRIAPDYLPAPAVWPMRMLITSSPTALIVPSQATLEPLGRRFRPGLPRIVLPLPVPAPAISRPRDETVRCVGIVGRLTAWKGQDVFLRAFASAFPTGTVRARVVGSALFGEDAYAASLRNLAAELNISDRVDFVGFRADVPGELAQMDIAVNASLLPETLGQTIVEALGAGIPTIAPRTGAPAEYLSDGVDALLHTPGDEVGLANAMRRLSVDRALRATLSDGGRVTAEQFSPNTIAPRFQDFYTRILGSSHR